MHQHGLQNKLSSSRQGAPHSHSNLSTPPFQHPHEARSEAALRLTPTSKPPVEQPPEPETPSLRQKVEMFWIGAAPANGGVQRFNSRANLSSNSLLPIVDPKPTNSYLDQLRKFSNVTQRLNPRGVVPAHPDQAASRLHPDLVVLERNSKQNLSPISQRNSKSRPLKGWLGDEATEDPVSSFRERWEIAKFQELTGNRSDKLSQELKKLELSSRSLLDKDTSDLSQHSQTASRVEAHSPLPTRETSFRGDVAGASYHRDDRRKPLTVKESFQLLQKEGTRSPKSNDSVIGLRQLVEDLKDKALTPKKRAAEQRTLLRCRVRSMRGKLLNQGLLSLIRWTAWKARTFKRLVLKALASGRKVRAA